jgi:hypothetical protein
VSSDQKNTTESRKVEGIPY